MSNVGQQLASGAVSGFASTVALQPFDLLKTRVQQGDGANINRNATTIVRTAREIVARNGLLSLWRGTTVTLIRNVPGIALYMTSLTQIRKAMLKYSAFAAVQTDHPSSSVLPKLNSPGNLIAGATARVAVGFILNPFSVLKARYESNIYAYDSLWKSLRSLARSGPSELFRGFAASALRDAPYAGLFVVFYEGIKRQSPIMGPPFLRDNAALTNSVSAASAGALATITTHPFDVVKTKVQVRSEERYQGFLRTVATIWKQRGPTGFFDGVSLRLSRKVLSSAIGWAIYEGILKSMWRD